MKVGNFEIDLPDEPLRSPHCIAMLRPWVNVGNVGHIVLGRLGRIYKATEIGQLERPGSFYDFTRYRPEMRFVKNERKVRVPNSVVLTGRAPESLSVQRDLVLLHMLEPHANSEEFNDSVLDLLRLLKIERYILIGGMYDSVPHSRPLRVTGSARGWEPPAEFGDVRLGLSNYQGPTSLTSQLTDRAHNELGIETLSLIVHMPLYLKLEDDYNGAYRIFQVLSELYGFSTDVPEKATAEQQYSQVTPAMKNNPQLQELVKKFESDYDQEAGIESGDEPVDLSPEIEKFLEDISRRAENEQDESQASGGI